MQDSSKNPGTKLENAFLYLIINLATRLINHPIERMDEAITDALRQIAELLGTMRTAINIFEEDYSEFVLLYQWTQSASATDIRERLITPYPEVLLPRLQRGETIETPNRDDLPENSDYRRILTLLGIRSIVMVPILRRGKLIGFISTSWSEARDLQGQIADLLRIVAEIFLNSLDRKENEHRIRKLNEELEDRIHDRTTELLQANKQLQAEIYERQQIEAELRISEERYRIISELMSDYAYQYRVAPDNSISVEWVTGDSYTRLTGYTADDIAKPFSRYHPDDELVARADIERVLNGEQIEREYRVITKSGEPRWIFTRRYPVWDEQENRVVRFFGVAQDITERKFAEETLRRSEEKFRATFEQAAVGIAHVAPDGPWLDVNKRLCEILGFSREEMQSITFQDITHPHDLETDLNYIRQLLAGEIQTCSMNKRYLHKADKFVWVKLTLSLVRDADNQPDYFVKVIEDITALKAARDALQQSEERYRITTELISDYAYLYRVEPDGSLVLEWLTEASFQRLTGYQFKDLTKTFRLYHPDDFEGAQNDIKQTIEGVTTEREYRFITKSNETRWIEMCRYPVWDEEHKRVDRFYGVAQDITERKHMQTEELEQRRLAEALLKTAQTLNSTFDLPEMLTHILTNIDHVVSHDVSTVMLIESDIARVVCVRDHYNLGFKHVIENYAFPLESTTNLQAVYETGQALIISDTRQFTGWRYIEGTEWIRSHACIPIKQEGDVLGFLTCESAKEGLFTDKTVRFLEAFAHQIALALTHTKLYQQGQELAVLQERQRLARDLHDAVTQTMFSASVIAETLPRLWESNQEQANKSIRQLRQLTRGAVAEMRSLLLELRPEALEGMTLPRLISQLAEAFTGQTGIVPKLVIEGDRALPYEVKVTLYRIAQEAFNNITKHARATETYVSLSLNNMVQLHVQDNGRGFNPNLVKSDSLGLKIMRERAMQIGAAFRIESEAGKQTILTIEWGD